MVPQLAAYAGKRVVLGMRPEDILDQRLVADRRPETTVEAVVKLVEAMGSETYLYLDAGVHSFVARVRPDDGVKQTQSLSVSFDMKKAHFFDAVTETAIAQAGWA
jgi:multiple sugar transport system ATP-binding protein